ncbi:MAG: hypothetical protein F6K56_07685 [Moorea sp. SIO3G5]|nr:hypothetical protein [Moorena sp. SIO3G5]
MNITIKIPELSIEGIDLNRLDRVRLQAAVEAELSRLLQVKGLPRNWQDTTNIPTVPVNLNLTKTHNPTDMGKEIAQAIYRGMAQ